MKSSATPASGFWIPIAASAQVRSKSAFMLVSGTGLLDGFVDIADGTPLPAEGPVIVSLARYQKARDTPLGVRLETAESPELLGEDVHNFALIVLHVPYFKDGRAFSWARLLRTRLGYKGEIRASGHVLKDQIAFFARVGVDSFDLNKSLSAAEIEAARKEISHVYQPSVDGQVTIRELRAHRANVSSS